MSCALSSVVFRLSGPDARLDRFNGYMLRTLTLGHARLVQANAPSIKHNTRSLALSIFRAGPGQWAAIAWGDVMVRYRSKDVAHWK